jgi:hypothetical protein
MSSEEDPKEDLGELSELEAALAALAPRAERLNRDRLMFLAGQASVEPKISQAAQPQLPSRWAWPVAFAAMSGIAASLLAALAIRPAPQASERIVERIVTVSTARQEPAAAIAQDRIEAVAASDARAIASPLPDWLALWLFAQPAGSTGHEPPYPELRNQVLLHGLNSWTTPASESTASARAGEEPVPAGELLNYWLEQEGGTNTLRRNTKPPLRNSSGAKS